MNKAAYGITTENLLRTLPEVLKNDNNTFALATAIAETIAMRTDEISRLMIYANIVSLPEELLDILAHDFKVDWYNYDYGIAAKRALIKDSFQVHRHLGTRGATEKALSDIYPGSQVEEWFEYGGQPYFFRVILDVTDPHVNISQAEIARAVNIYKSLRSHLEDEAIRYRSRGHIYINVCSGYTVYCSRRCGTYPTNATQGGITKEEMTLSTSGKSVVYSVPQSGMVAAGTYPTVSTQGGAEFRSIDIDATAAGVAYSVRYCGAVPGGIM